MFEVFEMNKYLFIYGDDNSLFQTTAPNFVTAFFEFTKYTGTSFSPVVEKALRAMNTPAEIIDLYSHFSTGYDEIQTVFKIDCVLYSEEKDGENNG